MSYIYINRSGDFKFRRPIIYGEQDEQPNRTGLAEIAKNHNTLWRNIGHPIIAAAPHTDVTLPGLSTDYDIAAYRFPRPKYLNTTASTGRRFLYVQVVGSVSSGTWLARGRCQSGGKVSAGATGNTVTSLVEIEIPIDDGPADDDYLVITVRGSVNGAVFSFESIAAWILPASGTLSGGETYKADVHCPIEAYYGEEYEWGHDAPLTVTSVQNLIRTNDNLWRNTPRAVVNFCAVQNYGTLWDESDPAVTASTWPDADGTINIEQGDNRGRWQFIYFPKAPMTRLRCYIDGYATSGIPGNIDCTFRFMGQDADSTDSTGTFAITTADYFGSASWAGIFEIPTPSGTGPYFLQIRVKAGEDQADPVRIAAISVYEKGEEV